MMIPLWQFNALIIGTCILNAVLIIPYAMYVGYRMGKARLAQRLYYEMPSERAQTLRGLISFK